MVNENEQRPKSSNTRPSRKPDHDDVKKAIANAEELLHDSIEPAVIRGWVPEKTGPKPFRKKPGISSQVL